MTKLKLMKACKSWKVIPFRFTCSPALTVDESRAGYCQIENACWRYVALNVELDLFLLVLEALCSDVGPFFQITQVIQMHGWVGVFYLASSGARDILTEL